MYSTCLFCNTSLGTNEAIEHFPVGRRLAYDNATGRLWVVCRNCARWNLSPLETRWEAMEEAERLFRATKLGTSSDNIGLARVAEGTELVRIGKPLKSEFAAWRYGDQFGRRRRKSLVAACGTVVLSVGAVGLMSGEHMLGIGSGPVATAMLWGGTALNFANAAISNRTSWALTRKPATAIRNNDDEIVRMTMMSVRDTAIRFSKPDAEWKLRVRNSIPRATGTIGRWLNRRDEIEPIHEYKYITGPAAMRALALILPHVNAEGAGRKEIQKALHVIDATPDVTSLIHKAATGEKKSQDVMDGAAGCLVTLPPEMRLALEIAMHSDDERRAMDGELAELEARWKEADAIAKIADNMLLPESVETSLDKLRHKSD
ncbi:MAG: hypothetical protein ACO1Q7_19050 [Gemmatimonas sp.]